MLPQHAGGIKPTSKEIQVASPGPKKNIFALEFACISWHILTLHFC